MATKDRGCRRGAIGIPVGVKDSLNKPSGRPRQTNRQQGRRRPHFRGGGCIIVAAAGLNAAVWSRRPLRHHQHRAVGVVVSGGQIEGDRTATAVLGASGVVTVPLPCQTLEAISAAQTIDSRNIGPLARSTSVDVRRRKYGRRIVLTER